MKRPFLTRKRREYPEFPIHAACYQFLVTALRNAVVFHPANEGEREEYQAERLKRLGLLPGVADLIVITGGRVYAIEVKAPGGRMTEAQLRFSEDIRVAGGEFACVTSLDELRLALKAWGIKTREVAA